MDIELQLRVESLLTRYVHCIDDDRLEEWPDFFSEDCQYKIISAENHERGLPIGIIFADSRDMLRDRVVALRRANIYEPHRYRHIVSSVLIRDHSDGIVTAQANYQVTRIKQDGSTMLFSVGRYLDRIAIDRPDPLYLEKLVIFDNERVDTLLAIPI
jgi:anthranilate 1,2-dioxygenase small subunit